MKRPADAPPPWEPRSRREQERAQERELFIEWTVQQWEDEYEGPPVGDWKTAPSGTGLVLGDTSEDIPATEAPWLVDDAVIRGDEERFVSLVRDPVLARRAFAMLRLQRQDRKPGRPKRPALPHLLDWPSEIVDQINAIWKRHYGRSARASDDPPSAYDVAVLIVRKRLLAGADAEARKVIENEITADKLRQHRRKHGRRRG